MKLSHFNSLDVKEGVYYNPETDTVFTLENKQFKMGNHEGHIGSTYVYDVHVGDTVEIGVMLPNIEKAIEFVGEL